MAPMWRPKAINNNIPKPKFGPTNICAPIYEPKMENMIVDFIEAIIRAEVFFDRIIVGLTFRLRGCGTQSRVSEANGLEPFVRA